MAAVKKLLWIDPQTGEISKPRKSPRKGVAQDVFRELYKIRPLLSHPNLSIRIALLEIEEYRCRDGWSADGKKGATRCDRIPSVFIKEIVLNTPSDYPVSYTHLRAHETRHDLVCRLLLEKKKHSISGKCRSLQSVISVN